MAENSKIEWTHHTFNPWEGCMKVSPGCTNCYAERRDQQYHDGQHWGPGGTRKMMSEAYWLQPIRWNANAEKFPMRCPQCRGWFRKIGEMRSYDCPDCAVELKRERPRVFCASLADVFEDRPELEAPRRRLFKLIQATPNLDWLLLTKRPENIYSLTYKAIDPADDPDCEFNIAGEPNGLDVADFGELYPNIWLGTTVESQEQADKRIPELLKIPAKVRFLSCEPLLGPVDLHSIVALDGDGPDPNLYWIGQDASIDWVIAGGESGPNARPAHPDWFRSLRDQCQAAGVAFHFKQWGAYEAVTPLYAGRDDSAEDGRGNLVSVSSSGYIFGDLDGQPNDPNTWLMERVGKRAAGRLLDGRTWDEFPQGKAAAPAGI